MILPISKPPCRRGFTLVELIVAMSLFTVILLLTAQVSNAALTITRSTEARLDTPVRFEKKLAVTPCFQTHETHETH